MDCGGWWWIYFGCSCVVVDGGKYVFAVGGWWWMVMHIFWLVAGGGGYILAGGE